jgi:hypothetical protein
MVFLFSVSRRVQGRNSGVIAIILLVCTWNLKRSIRNFTELLGRNFRIQTKNETNGLLEVVVASL